MCNLDRIFVFERMFEDSFNSSMKMDVNYFKLYYYNFIISHLAMHIQRKMKKRGSMFVSKTNFKVFK